MLLMTTRARRIGEVKSDEAPGFVERTLLTHRPLNAGAITERLVRRQKDAGMIVAPRTR